MPISYSTTLNNIRMFQTICDIRCFDHSKHLKSQKIWCLSRSCIVVQEELWWCNLGFFVGLSMSNIWQTNYTSLKKQEHFEKRHFFKSVATIELYCYFNQMYQIKDSNFTCAAVTLIESSRWWLSLTACAVLRESSTMVPHITVSGSVNDSDHARSVVRKFHSAKNKTSRKTCLLGYDWTGWKTCLLGYFELAC
jgi:hypothetical protein